MSPVWIVFFDYCIVFCIDALYAICSMFIPWSGLISVTHSYVVGRRRLGEISFWWTSLTAWSRDPALWSPAPTTSILNIYYNHEMPTLYLCLSSSFVPFCLLKQLFNKRWSNTTTDLPCWIKWVHALSCRFGATAMSKPGGGYIWLTVIEKLEIYARKYTQLQRTNTCATCTFHILNVWVLTFA